ncbi:MAG: GYD domain-containing protein [bacterium]
MATYIMLSRLTEEGAETIRKNPGRVQEVNKELEGMRVRVLQQYAVLGAYDFVNIVEAPDLTTVMKASIQLGARGSVRIETLAAVPMDEFVRVVR